MPRLIPAPSVIQAAGTKPKRIEEFTGRVNSGHSSVSVARMQSPSGWVEPGQRPDFEEVTIVLRLVSGLTRPEVEGIVGRVQRELARSEIVAQRIDSLELKLAGA